MTDIYKIFYFIRWSCWIAKRPILNKAHDAATNNGPAITSKRVSINDNPFEIFKLTTLYIIYYSQKN